MTINFDDLLRMQMLQLGLLFDHIIGALKVIAPLGVIQSCHCLAIILTRQLKLTQLLHCFRNLLKMSDVLFLFSFDFPFFTEISKCADCMCNIFITYCMSDNCIISRKLKCYVNCTFINPLGNKSIPLAKVHGPILCRP